jgi:hypothetical protein
MRRPVPTYGKAFPDTWRSRRDRKRGGAGEGGNEGERGEKKKRECTFFKERERRIVVRITNKAPTTCAVEVLPPIGSFPRRAAP